MNTINCYLDNLPYDVLNIIASNLNYFEMVNFNKSISKDNDYFHDCEYTTIDTAQ